jgi:hypothetical protein
MTGPRKDYPCGCVYDTIDGERRRLVRCSDPAPHGESAELFRDALKSGFFVHIFAEPLEWHLVDGQVLGPFAADGSPR